ncbi:MAG: hypothetical protein KJ067_03460 [Vicinamibacteria bacterium]|nr:hypothetical protein [Vicinamibacteria bacterium]
MTPILLDVNVLIVDRWGVTAVLEPFTGALQGHRQVADAYLLGLALRHEGKLATFDAGIRALAADPRHARAVELISRA